MTAPREHHELNPFGNPDSFNQSGDGYGQECTSFIGDHDQGYQQSGSFIHR